MSERFQTFITRLRPHRIAILTDIADVDWQNTCLAIIEYLSQVWGGYHSLIVPTDGRIIEDNFWALLSAFDPDVILKYQKTGADLARGNPGEFERIAAANIERVREQGIDAVDSAAEIHESLMEAPLYEFAILPELAEQLLLRLAPFHLENELPINFLQAGSSPAYPFTSVADLIEFVAAPDVIFGIKDNLPPEREAPPPLWLAAEVGVVTPNYEAALLRKDVTCVPKFMNPESDSGLIGWGIQPGRALGVSSPFAFSRLALATVRAREARRHTVPSVIVRGDTLRDFCLYYALTRLHGRAIWLPSWFDPVLGEYSSRSMIAIRKLEEMGRFDGSQTICVVSGSVPSSELLQIAGALRGRARLSSFMVEDATSGTFIRRIVEHPSKVYAKKNIDQITTHQIVDDRMPGFFESPVPLSFTHVNPQIHRWVVETSFMSHEMPRHPALGRHVASGPNLGDVRAGSDGVAFQCPGMLVMGDDIELQMLRLSVSVPGPEKVFRIVLNGCGYDCQVSDKGRYEGEVIGKFGGLERAAAALRGAQTSQLLKEFLSKRGRTEGVFDEGDYLSDKRRYLNFACILKYVPKDASARTIIDEYIGRGIFYRGLILKCMRCSNVAWFSIADITQNFTCGRCGTNQQFTYSSWHYPNEPSWSYKLDEMVYQMLQHNGDVALVTLEALRRESKRSFQFTPELSIKPHATAKWKMEIDIACIMDGKLIIGETKSVATLATKDITAREAARRYRDLAEQLGASGAIFSTSAPAWDEPTRKAIDEAFAHSPHLKIYRYAAAQL